MVNSEVGELTSTAPKSNQSRNFVNALPFIFQSSLVSQLGDLQQKSYDDYSSGGTDRQDA